MIIYTDGSAHPNPGPGGYGVVVVDDAGNIVSTRSRQYDGPVTNNEMELKAILWAMWNYGNKTNPPTVYSDSAYCVNSLTNWVWGWVKNGWTKSDGGPVQNADIMSAFVELWRAGYQINLVKVKGHVGNVYNEMADKLATGKTQINTKE